MMKEETQMYTQFVIPDEFTGKKKVFSFGMNMKFKDKKGNVFGTIVQEKLLSFGTTLKLLDTKENVIAGGHIKGLTLGTLLTITDEKQSKIGSIEHQVWKSCCAIGDIFTVRDKGDTPIGKTEETKCCQTAIVIKDQHDHIVGDMNKGCCNITGDAWNCYLQGNIDKRILIFLPALVSKIQQQRAAAAANSS